MTSALRSAIPLLGFIAFLAINHASDANENHIIKVMVLVDKIGIQRWMKQTGKPKSAFMDELEATFEEVRNIYDSLKKYGLNIQPQMESLTILNHNLPSMEKDRLIDDIVALNEANDLAKRHQNGNPTDIVLVLTGSNLYYGHRSRTVTLGLTYPGSSCTDRNAVVMKLSGTFITATGIAHEFGHAIGAPHDGDDQSVQCPADGGYLMKGQGAFNPLNFLFSRCSADAIKGFINRLNREGRNCLRDGQIQRHKGPGLAHYVSPDQLCERLLGRSAYVDRIKYALQEEKCVYLPCTAENKSKPAQIPNGFDCGRNKKCHQGKCVPARNSVRYEYCPFGSSNKASKSNFRSCNQVSVSQCDINTMSSCCERCMNAQTAVLTPDIACQFNWDYRARLEVEHYKTTNDQLCNNLQCRVAELSMSEIYSPAPEGMLCGKNKVCKNKRCVKR